MMKLDRDIYNLLGLSFDAISMDGAVMAVRQAIAEDEKLFISTPNLNFLVASQKNEAFRKSVLHSDLNIADGMPIVFMCKMLDIPISERVAGSSLIDELRKSPECAKNPIRVFFFGGQDGIGEKAHQKLNEQTGGLISVGFLNPGFGSVEDMSSSDIIDQINNAKPQFIIVSLGALKGQAWIMHNRARLNTNVISHLGAVVNFIAGSVRRAPDWVQKIHMEWLWRIKEEPSLFKRYWTDGISFLKFLVTKIWPYRRIIKAYRVHSTPVITPDFENNNVLYKGDVTVNLREEITAICEKIIQSREDFSFDMAGVTYIDQSILGLFLVFGANMVENDCRFCITGLNDRMTKIFKLNNMNFTIQNE